MLQFWNNAEFTRHRRAELRRGRAIVVGLVVLMICALTILGCWASAKAKYEAYGHFYHQDYSRDGTVRYLPPVSVAETTAVDAYRWLIFMQFGVLTFWSLLSCAQSISRERERGTWDFQRTTQLSPADLLAGKLLGEPVLAYFIVLCSLPVTVTLGIMANFKLGNIFSAYIVIFAGALFIGLAGLWFSSLFESKSRGIGLLGALAMYGVFLSASSMADSPFPGLAGFSPLTLLLRLVNAGGYRRVMHPTIFGGEVSWLAMSLLLYGTFGAWVALMLVRNLKRDLQETELLSRWQAVGCCAFLNFVFYALFNPTRNPELQQTGDFVVFMAAMNGLILFFLGLTMLSTQERLDVGHGSLRSIFSNHSLQWPWLLISGMVSYVLLIWGLFAWGKVLDFDARTLQRAALSFLVVLVFIVRDVLFIQWCKLTRLRAPLLKGVLFLALYYSACGVLFGVMSVTSSHLAQALANVLTPSAALQASGGAPLPSATTGLVVQLMVIGFLISAVRSRVQRPGLIVAPAA